MNKKYGIFITFCFLFLVFLAIIFFQQKQEENNNETIITDKNGNVVDLESGPVAPGSWGK